MIMNCTAERRSGQVLLLNVMLSSLCCTCVCRPEHVQLCVLCICYRVMPSASVSFVVIERALTHFSYQDLSYHTDVMLLLYFAPANCHHVSVPWSGPGSVVLGA